MLDRLISKKILESSKSILLLGPRQTGKSTLLESLNPDLTVNLAMESEFLRYSSDIDILESLIESERPQLVFIDEIQRIPSMLNTIQAIIDKTKGKRPIKFLLSGSSARKLRRGHANLLPGRVFTYNLGGLSAKELEYKMDLKKALSKGCLPEPYFEKNSETSRKLLESYASTYLKEEIQAEALSRNIQGFARFLAFMANASGTVLDYSKISTKVKVSRTSCIRFVEILEDTLVAQRVCVFEDAEAADTIKHPKIYFFDVGVLNGLLNNFEVSPDRIGNLFEHFIFSQIRNTAMALDLPCEIFFFRTRSGVEVDFIVKLKNKIWAIEVKVGDITSSDLSGLRAFRNYYPKVHKSIAVSTKEKSRIIDNILITNWLEMLKLLTDEK